MMRWPAELGVRAGKQGEGELGIMNYELGMMGGESLQKAPPCPEPGWRPEPGWQGEGEFIIHNS